MARERLEQEALRLFAQQGYAGTSVRSIVEAAGVTKPALYYHFSSKAGLYHHLVEQHIEGWLGVVRGLFDGPGSTEERVRQYVRLAVVGAQEHPDVLRFMHQACARTEGAAPSGLDWQAREARLLTELVSRGVASGELETNNPRESGMALMAMIQWRCFASLHPEAPLSEEVALHIADIWLKGVQTCR